MNVKLLMSCNFYTSYHSLECVRVATVIRLLRLLNTIVEAIENCQGTKLFEKVLCLENEADYLEIYEITYFIHRMYNKIYKHTSSGPHINMIMHV